MIWNVTTCNVAYHIYLFLRNFPNLPWAALGKRDCEWQTKNTTGLRKFYVVQRHCTIDQTLELECLPSQHSSKTVWESPRGRGQS